MVDEGIVGFLKKWCQSYLLQCLDGPSWIHSNAQVMVLEPFRRFIKKKKKKKVDLRQIWSSNEISPHLQSNYYIQYKHMTIMVQGL